MDDSVLLAQFDEMVRSGLVSYDDAQRIIVQKNRGLEFQFVVSAALAKKPTFHTGGSSSTANVDAKLRPGSDISTEGYEIASIRESHILAANKFSYARPHLMLLTSDGHRRQYEPLDQSDFESAWAVLRSLREDYVVFYNCGKRSGCSRLHKHMQVMPMPSRSFASFLETGEAEPSVPFQWFHQKFDFPSDTSTSLAERYAVLMKEATLAFGKSGADEDNGAEGDAIPHNFLLTKQWMMVIPRRNSGVNQETGANALGMVGVMAVSMESEMQKWVSLGLAKSLAILGLPKK